MRRKGHQGRGVPATGYSPMLQVRYEQVNIDRVVKAAEQAGITKSEWVRRAVDKALDKAKV